jgi:hypothetical protein
MDWVQEMSKWLGQMVFWFVGAVGVAFAVFRFLGSKWIENKFAGQLERHKHEQAKELEELRHKINSAFNRLTKIHEKEFEVLPQAWYKLQDALGRISGVTSLLQQYPDLDRMGATQLAEFIQQSDLFDFEKEELRKTNDKNAYYRNKRFWHDLKSAKDAFWDFHNYTIRNRIFLSSDLFGQFRRIDDVMWEGIVLREEGEEGDDREMRMDANSKIKDEVNPVRDEIERQIQRRLHYHEAE